MASRNSSFYLRALGAINWAHPLRKLASYSTVRKVSRAEKSESFIRQVSKALLIAEPRTLISISRVFERVDLEVTLGRKDTVSGTPVCVRELPQSRNLGGRDGVSLAREEGVVH